MCCISWVWVTADKMHNGYENLSQNIFLDCEVSPHDLIWETTSGNSNYKTHFNFSCNFYSTSPVIWHHTESDYMMIIWLFLFSRKRIASEYKNWDNESQSQLNTTQLPIPGNNISTVLYHTHPPIHPLHTHTQNKNKQTKTQLSVRLTTVQVNNSK